MCDKLRAYRERQAHLTKEEYVIMDTLICSKFLKGEFLLREGEIAQALSVTWIAVPLDPGQVLSFKLKTVNFKPLPG
jgi:hypothetical protein